MDVRIESARPEDLAAMLALLDQYRLPHAALERHVADAVVARDGSRVVGCAAVERYGPSGLLRSVAVDGPLRRTGLGGRLTDAALAHARVQGVRTVYLLTETAAEFFPRFGFRPIARDAVDPAVRASVEFTSACPSTALAMVKEL
jgi:amino-acid N-acetyltransferase